MAKTIAIYIDEWLFDNAVNWWDITPAKALVRFNRYLHKLENEIAIFLMENSYDDWIKINLVDWQKDYNLPTWDSSWPTIPWISEFKKLLECSVNYDWPTSKWYKAIELPDGSLPNPIERYSTENSTKSPMFKFLWKNTLTIYPTPKKSVTDWLKLRYSKTDYDVELATLETALSIPRQYIPVILDGMSYQLAKTIKDKDLLAILERDYKESKRDMMAQLSDRYSQPVQYHNPNLYNLMN